MVNRGTLICFLAVALSATPAAALEHEWGEVNLKMINKFTVGAGWRLQDPARSNLGILNVPGQQGLCEADDCLSFANDIAPNERLKAAKGGNFLHAVDDGTMNYQRHDLVAALAKLNADWSLSWGEWTLKTNFVGFFDHENVQFLTTRNNTVQCADADCSDYLLQPGRRARLGGVENRLSVHAEVRELFLSRSFEVGDYEIFTSFGRQRLRWGEANLTLLNTLDVINPQDAVLARQPGLALNELNIPVGLFTVGSDVAEGITVDAFYQFEWLAVRPEPAGSFYSSSDVAGGGNYAVLGQGQYPEDPDALWFSKGTTGLISNSHRTVFVPDEETYAPDDGGQYGLRVKWFLPDFNNGTELGFYFANYHSRLPYLSAFAAQESCLRNATSIGEAINLCDGFNAASNRGQGAPLEPERCDPRGCDLAAYFAREPLPTDTMGLFLDFPENIQMYGVSFNTTVGGWSLAGEYAFRPNLPAQLLLSDVVYAGLQTAIGREDIPFSGAAFFVPDPTADPFLTARTAELLADFAATGDPNNLNAVLPGARTIFPDYITPYRGYDNSDPANDINPGQYIAGYERLKVGQFALSVLKLISTNPFGSDDIIVLGEVGFTHVVDMPKEIYFQGNGDLNHPSPGADGTGENDGDSAPQTTSRINPTQMTRGFAEDFAWGVRSLVQLNYTNCWNKGITLKPTILAFWDVEGIAPSPMQNYVEGNKWLIPGLILEYGSSLSGSLLLQYFTGGDYNLLKDRDSVSLSVTYTF